MRRLGQRVRAWYNPGVERGLQGRLEGPDRVLAGHDQHQQIVDDEAMLACEPGLTLFLRSRA